MDVWTQMALHNEHNVYHHLGLRCRGCEHINEPDPDFSVPVPLDVTCGGCSEPVPEVAWFTPGVDPFAPLYEQFEPIVWCETG